MTNTQTRSMINDKIADVILGASGAAIEFSHLSGNLVSVAGDVAEVRSAANWMAENLGAVVREAGSFEIDEEDPEWTVAFLVVPERKGAA